MIIRIIVLGVQTYTLYKKFFTTVKFGSCIISKEAGVQTEPLDNTTSCENVTSVGSESAFPKLIAPSDISYDVADKKTFLSYVLRKKYTLNIDDEKKTSF